MTILVVCQRWAIGIHTLEGRGVLVLPGKLADEGRVAGTNNGSCSFDGAKVAGYRAVDGSPIGIPVGYGVVGIIDGGNKGLAEGDIRMGSGVEVLAVGNGESSGVWIGVDIAVGDTGSIATRVGDDDNSGS